MTKNMKLQAGRPSSRRNQDVSLASISNNVGETKRVNFDLSAALHQKLRRYAVEQNKSIKDILTEFIESLPN